ncbi:formate dehydrogenase accessory sulfurtransferase FdhD [Thalassiella azotivora]
MTRRTPVVRLRLPDDPRGRPLVTTRPDAVAVEEPLEIRVDGEPLVTTMRTPGHDLDLALGFLLTEGLLPGPQAVATGVHCSDVDEQGSPTFNVLELTLAAGVAPPDLAGRRTFGVTSACGVCGSASVDAVRERGAPDLGGDAVTVDARVLAGLPQRLREVQGAFERTGGLHGAALFEADGTLVAAAEDVGRHNAVDKVLGRCARERGWPLTGTVLALSGRASFELVQKAWVAGVPVVAAVSAPSSLAVEVARSAGQTLVGFLRPPTLNVYAGPQRVLGAVG